MELVLESEASNGSDVSSGEVSMNKPMEDYSREWTADEILRMYQSEAAQEQQKSYQVLRRLLVHLQEIKPRAYRSVKYTDLKNPKTSDVYLRQGGLPASFPIDCFYACQKLSVEEREFILNYYMDYSE